MPPFASTLVSSPAMQVAVIGSGIEHEARAEEVGRLLAERGVTVVCGGRLEVMAAAARGAKQAGGTTIGILPGEARDEANEWIDYAVVTGIGHGRNLAVAATGDAAIAVGGSWDARGDRLREAARPAGGRARAGLADRGRRPRRDRWGGRRVRDPRARPLTTRGGRSRPLVVRYD